MEMKSSKQEAQIEQEYQDKMSEEAAYINNRYLEMLEEKE